MRKTGDYYNMHIFLKEVLFFIFLQLYSCPPTQCLHEQERGVVRDGGMRVEN